MPGRTGTTWSTRPSSRKRPGARATAGRPWAPGTISDGTPATGARPSSSQVEDGRVATVRVEQLPAWGAQGLTEAKWDRLVARASTPVPFLTWAFQTTWWRAL